MLILILQFCGIVVPLLGVVAMLQNNSRSESAVRLMLASIGCAVLNSGCLLMESASSEASAGMALKFQYLGNALFYSFFIAFLLSYQHIRVPRAVFWGWGIFETVVVIIYWSDFLQERFIGHFNFIRDNTFHVFRAEVMQSPLYLFRCVCLIVLLTVGLCYTVVLMLRTKPLAERMNLGRLIGAQLIIVAALLYQISAQPRFDCTSLCNSLAMLSVVISMLTDGFFGVTDFGHEWVFAQMPNAYIITDNLYGYLDANDRAKELYPELARLHQGAVIPKTLAAVFTENDVQYRIGDHVYSKKITEIRHRGMIVGYGALLMDMTEEERHAAFLRDFNTQLQNKVDAKTEHIRQMQNSIITGMASVVESRDNSTGGHINRTSSVVHIFAQHLAAHSDEEGMDFPPRFLHNVAKAAPMHDIGKIAVDDQILRKPGRFTDEEYAIMKSHAAEGAKMLVKVLREVDDTDFVRIAINVAHFHHERWDGKGYPDALSGTDIPLEARIMALADVFDALVSKRCYKEAFTFDRAFTIIEESLGTQFDPALGKIFLECRPELEAFYTSLDEEPAQPA